ncbi:MAG: CHASE domain-containing protein [Rhodobacter sp.]|nr:CHASE domain-containing protein [Rhodobacter sp.]
MAVACLGLALAFALPLFSVYYSHQRHNALVQSHAESLRTALQLRLSLIENQVSGAAGFLSAGRHIDAATFAEFMRKTSTSKIGQALRAVAYMPALRRGEIHLVEQFFELNSDAFRDEEYPPFQLFPATDNKAMFPVVLVEPEAARAQVFGFDLASSPVRLSRAQQALRTDRLVLTDPLTLSQDDAGAPVSLLLIAPVKVEEFSLEHNGLPSLRGVVAASVTPVHVVEELLRDTPAHEVLVELRMGPWSLPGLVFDRRGAPDEDSAGPLSHRASAAPLTLRFANRAFRMTYSESVSLTAREIANAAVLFLLSLMATALGIAYRWRQQQTADEITTRLAAQEEELRKSGQLIAQAQKQEALGNLVGGVAHDFNNLLAVILGNAELLDEDIPSQERAECARQIKLATERGGTLSRQLLSFGRRAVLEPGRQDIAEFMAELESMLRRVLPETIDLRCHVAPDTAPIFIDRNQLDTAVLNLAINARDAMPTGGSLIIEARNVSLDAAFVAEGDEELPSGSYVMLAVRDTGHGMSPEMADQAFDPFFTTKPVGQGSGLGLSMVLGFVRQSGGTVRLVSEKGKGTSIELYFAALDAAAAATPIFANVNLLEDLHVLLCEDEPPVRQVLKRQLVSAGYQVTCTPDGEAALRKLRDGLRPDVLLTDVVMPGSVQGPDLVLAARKLVPGISTILISGYPRDAEEAASALPGDTVVLQKPVKKRDLLDTIVALTSAGPAAEAAE